MHIDDNLAMSNILSFLRLAKPLAWDERPYSNLGLQAFKLDGQDNTVATTGLSFLFSYWIGRYFGVIE